MIKHTIRSCLYQAKVGIYYRQARTITFKEQNPLLTKCMTSNTQGANHIVINLITLSQNDIELEDYIQYIASYITLLTNLCRGRKEEYISYVGYHNTIDNI